MKQWAAGTCESLLSTLWFLPTLSTIVAAGAALGLVQLDQYVEPEAVGIAWLVFGGGPDGARGVLSAVASSVMTVAGVTFSITVLTLSLASQQFTPRVLRQFTSDRGNQAVLGVFLGTYVYCLLVLRTIRADGFGEFVPHFAVTGAVVLALASLGILLYFIHHVSTAIQVDTVLQNITEETHLAIRRLFPDPLGQSATQEEGIDLKSEGVPQGHPDVGQPLIAPAEGYLQGVNEDRLMQIARQERLVLRLEYRIGEFVHRQTPIATIFREDPLPTNGVGALQSSFTQGRNRTVSQDPEFGVVQIVDIALKALSPGINDPTTAVSCLDYLTGILQHMGTRAVPSPLRRSKDGEVRVIARGTDFHRMSDLAFRQILRYGASDASVCAALLRCVEQVGVTTVDPEQRQALRKHAQRIASAAERELSDPEDQAEIASRAKEVLKALTGSPPQKSSK